MKRKTILNPKKRYLQVALNSTMEEAHKIINQLPISDRIILEAGTPLIKRYGLEGIKQIRMWYQQRLSGGLLSTLGQQIFSNQLSHYQEIFPYIVADLKTMDRGATEVQLAVEGGASAAIALGSAPIETLNSFLEACAARGLDSMVDMMNVGYPISVLRSLKKVPDVVILHRGVDEESNREKMLPLHEIRRIKGNYNVLISVAGGDTSREVQSVVFNDADIVVIWKSVFQSTDQTVALVQGFLKEIK